jgi:hypothetical protein
MAGFGFEILTVMAMKSAVFWVVTPCIKNCDMFIQSMPYHNSFTRKYREAACFLPGLLFDPQGGGNVLLGNFA